MDETFCCRLKADASAEWYTLEGQFSEWDVQFKSLAELGIQLVISRRVSLDPLTEDDAASAIFSAKAFTSLFIMARRFRSCCSISISSSSPYRCLRFLFPVSSNWTSVASRKNCTS